RRRRAVVASPAPPQAQESGGRGQTCRCLSPRATRPHAGRAPRRCHARARAWQKPSLRSGKADHKAGATALVFGGADAPAARAISFMETVLSPQTPAMGDHDLPRNIEAETRILAEALLRPVGIEALENPLQILRRNARAFVLDRDLNLVAHALRLDRHAAPRRREGDGVVEEVDDHLAQAAVMADAAIGAGPAAIGDVEHHLGRVV